MNTFSIYILLENIIYNYRRIHDDITPFALLISLYPKPFNHHGDDHFAAAKLFYVVIQSKSSEAMLVGMSPGYLFKILFSINTSFSVIYVN